MGHPRFDQIDSTASLPGAVAQFFVGLVATFVATIAISLAVVAIAVSVLAGWAPVALTSGSMSPVLWTGDIVIAQPHDGLDLRAGTIVVFDDPVGPGQITHRIVAVNPDGGYTTKGDAQPRLDSTPLYPESVVGVGRVVVPFAGIPLVWWWDGAWVRVATFVLTAAATLWLSRWGMLDRFDPWRRRVDGAVPSVSRPESVGRDRDRSLGRYRERTIFGGYVALTAGAALVSALLLGGVDPVRAGFDDSAANAASSFAAASAFCEEAGSDTVYSEADTYVKEGNPEENNGTDTELKVRSTLSEVEDERRVLVRFDLPTVPGGCSLTSATLRMYANESDSDRTIAVYRNSASWTEDEVTWDDMPEYTGTAVTASSEPGWQTWTVTDHVASMYSGSNHGFLVMDLDEGDGMRQTYWSREGSESEEPELIVNWG